MKKPTKADKKRVYDLIQDLQFLFSVQNLDRSLIFKEEENEEVVAEIAIEEDYQRINIRIYPGFWKNSLQDQRAYILHEFCHIMVHPLNEFASNLLRGIFQGPETKRVAVEKVTSTVCNVVDGLLRMRYKYARKAYADYLGPKKKKKAIKKRP